MKVIPCGTKTSFLVPKTLTYDQMMGREGVYKAAGYTHEDVRLIVLGSTTGTNTLLYYSLTTHNFSVAINGWNSAAGFIRLDDAQVCFGIKEY